MTLLRWLTLGLLSVGCAGQLDLPPEAYNSGLTAAGGAAGAAAPPMDGGISTSPWPPPDADAADADAPTEPTATGSPDAGATGAASPTEVGLAADA
ncbi:MAG TPA: hypothetical protein VGG33_11605, partial [Polyangia bacterium]